MDREYVTKSRQRIRQRASRIESQLDSITKKLRISDEEDLKLGESKTTHACFLFVDIRRFTERTRHSDDKEIIHILNIFLPEMVSVVGDYEGQVEKFTGDGLLAVLGMDSSSPATYVVNSVKCAMTMMYIVEHEINAYLQEQNIDPIHCGIGINAGETMIAKIGRYGSPEREGHFETVSVGYPVNIASKLEAIAGEKEIMIGEEVKKYLPEPWQQERVCIPQLSDSERMYYDETRSIEYPYYKFAGRWIGDQEDS